MGKLAEAIPGDRVGIEVDRWSEPYWNAAKGGRLVACQCAACGTFRMPPGPFCPKCSSGEVNWKELSGRGEIYSFVICHRSPYPAVPDFTYAPVLVELEGAPGIRLISNIVDIDTDAVAIGMPVQVDFHEIRDGWKTPIFRAVEGG